METTEEMDPDIIINKTDGLSLNDDDDEDLSCLEKEEEEEGKTRLNERNDQTTTDAHCNVAPLPNVVVIVTNVLESVFTSTDVKLKFESLFQQFDPSVQFQYLKCFHRARVVFTSVEKAAEAHSGLNDCHLLGQRFRCYFAQPITMKTGSNGLHHHLEPPPLEKQFLISPPSSPPVGWEVITEREPFVNYDLIAAMAKLGPGESYELHSGSESQPSIFVHVCEDPTGYEKRPPIIPQTRCPDRNP